MKVLSHPVQDVWVRWPTTDRSVVRDAPASIRTSDDSEHSLVGSATTRSFAMR